MYTEQAPLLCRQRGMTLIEVVVFIVIVSVALSGILSVLDITLRHSADPIVQKQALAVASSLLEEIESKPFTWCDPDDPNAAAASSAAGCTAGMAQGLGPTPSSESRSGSNPFDNVGDYAGFSMPAGIYNPGDNSTIIAGLERYAASVDITQVGSTFGLADNTAVLQIAVTVQALGSGLPSMTLTGYRFRYAPN